MANITLYRITCTEAYRMDETGIRYALRPWGNNTEYYRGEDDGGQEYRLPDGYTLDETADGQPAIFSPDGAHCRLFTQRGLPAIVDRDSVIGLARA